MDAVRLAQPVEDRDPAHVGQRERVAQDPGTAGPLQLLLERIEVVRHVMRAARDHLRSRAAREPAQSQQLHREEQEGALAQPMEEQAFQDAPDGDVDEHRRELDGLGLECFRRRPHRGRPSAQ